MGCNIRVVEMGGTNVGIKWDNHKSANRLISILRKEKKLRQRPLFWALLFVEALILYSCFALYLK